MRANDRQALQEQRHGIVPCPGGHAGISCRELTDERYFHLLLWLKPARRAIAAWSTRVVSRNLAGYDSH